MLLMNIIVFGIVFKFSINKIKTFSFLYLGFLISIMLYVILGQSKDCLYSLISDRKFKKTCILFKTLFIMITKKSIIKTFEK